MSHPSERKQFEIVEFVFCSGIEAFEQYLLDTTDDRGDAERLYKESLGKRPQSADYFVALRDNHRDAAYA